MQVLPVIKFPVGVGPQQLKLFVIMFRCRRINMRGFRMLLDYYV